MRLSRLTPGAPNEFMSQLMVGVSMAAVLTGSAGQVYGFCSLYELTGHGTAFVEAEAGSSPDEETLRSELLQFAVEQFPPEFGVRKVFLKCPASYGLPSCGVKIAKECVIPEAVYCAGKYEDLLIYGIPLR